MNTRLLPILSLFAVCIPRAEENAHNHNQAVYASPIAMMYYSGLTDVAVISGAYEHGLTASGYSLFVPVHAGYLEDGDELNYALGAGLGLRKYFGSSFAGSYLTVQSDLVRYQDYQYHYGPYTQLPDGTWSYGDTKTAVEEFVSITQLAYGYKWDWRQFTLDLTIGGAFYAKEDEKYTNVIGGVNLGFPFNAGMFGFR